MKELFEFAAEVQQLCEQHHWEFCFIGGIAVQRWSEPRLTKDVDITLITGFGSEEQFVDTLLGVYEPRRPDAREFALLNRVLLLKSPRGIGIDAALGGLPFERSAVQRATYYAFLPKTKLRTCSAEDLVVFKSFAGRPLDWQDVKMTIARQGSANLDWGYIFGHLKELAALKEQPEIVRQLQALKAEFK